MTEQREDLFRRHSLMKDILERSIPFRDIFLNSKLIYLCNQRFRPWKDKLMKELEMNEGSNQYHILPGISLPTVVLSQQTSKGFYRLIKYLHENDREFSLIFRTFGQDIELVLKCVSDDH